MTTADGGCYIINAKRKRSHLPKPIPFSKDNKQGDADQDDGRARIRQGNLRLALQVLSLV
jgi:hypothetical protein